MTVFFNSVVTATANSSVRTTHHDRRGVKRLFQASISVAGTVTLQGRVSGEMPWVTITSRTASGAELVDVYPEMQCTLAGNTGSVSVVLDD